METLEVREKHRQIKRGIPTKLLISQLLITLE